MATRNMSTTCIPVLIVLWYVINKYDLIGLKHL